MSAPEPAIRRLYIITKFKKCGALSERAAMTLEEAGVSDPGSMPEVTDKLIKDRVLIKTKDNKYYLNR